MPQNRQSSPLHAHRGKAPTLRQRQGRAARRLAARGRWERRGKELSAAVRSPQDIVRLESNPKTRSTRRLCESTPSPRRRLRRPCGPLSGLLSRMRRSEPPQHGSRAFPGQAVRPRAFGIKRGKILAEGGLRSRTRAGAQRGPRAKQWRRARLGAPIPAHHDDAQGGPSLASHLACTAAARVWRLRSSNFWQR